MNLHYHSHYECPKCMELFVVHVPVYIRLFMPALLDKAFKTHELSILIHSADHLFEHIWREYARYKEAKG